MIRLDDRRLHGSCWRFDDAVSSGRADALDDVVKTVAAADERARHHAEWVVVVIAYEAAPAFDRAMRTAPRPPHGTPFVWWQSFRERVAALPLRPASQQLTSGPKSGTVRRRANRLPYTEAVEVIRAHIADGDVYQANLCDRFDGRFAGTPIDLYAELLAAQSCEFGAYIEMDDAVVVSASPELFFEWRGDRLTCRPMKGTANRLPRAADDIAAGRALLASEKDRAENVMIVDLLRNDLGRIARIGSVEVPELFSLERYETVWQMTSTITAAVAGDTRLVDVLTALFPCGSVTGAPKLAAMATIADLEVDPRGVYCGAIGVLAPRGTEPRAVFSVPIRTAVLDAATSTFEYGAGAGITWSSSAVDEDHEVEAKTRILRRRLPDLSLLETLRLDQSGLRHADLHVARLAASAVWFGIPFDPDDLLARLAALEPLSGIRAERVRIVLDPDGTNTVTREEFVDGGDAPVRLAIDRVVTRSDDPLCCHKTTARSHFAAARERHPDVDDVILVNEHGNVIETTIANLAVHADGRWWCPPLGDGGLAGIARHVAIERGELAERSFTASDVRAADRLCVLNDLRGWRPAIIV